MGSNSKHAVGAVTFILAFVFLAAAFANGGSLLYIILAVAVFAVSVVVFRQARMLEGGD